MQCFQRAGGGCKPVAEDSGGLSLLSWNRENCKSDEVALPVIAASRHGACRSPRGAVR